MKIISIIFLTTLLSFIYESKKYSYSNNHFSETIELGENNKFEYSAKIHMRSKMKINGSYYIVNDSLFLNSIPQRDKLIVNEQFNSKRKKENCFNVIDKDYSLLTYHLYIELENGKNLVFRDQFEKTIFPREKIKSFYLIDTKGLKSSTYKIKGQNTNSFHVIFETKRIFENESWLIKGDSIKPKGFDGVFQEYFLSKID